MICGICHGVLDEPKQCCQNGHVFCNNCLEQHLKKSDVCPNNCPRIPVADSLAAKKWIDELEVYCEFHFSYDCDKDDWVVKEDGCNFIAKAGEIATHEKNCQHAWLDCPYCAETFTAKEMPSHKEECDQKPVQCTICNQMYLTTDSEVFKQSLLSH